MAMKHCLHIHQQVLVNFSSHILAVLKLLHQCKGFHTFTIYHLIKNYLTPEQCPLRLD